MIFNDFGVYFATLFAPLGTLLASFLERIRGLLALRVSGRLLGWIWELFLMVLGAIFDGFGSYFDGLRRKGVILCVCGAVVNGTTRNDAERRGVLAERRGTTRNDAELF